MFQFIDILTQKTGKCIIRKGHIQCSPLGWCRGCLIWC